MHCNSIEHFPFEFFAANLKRKYFVVVLSDTIVETSEVDMFKEIKKGIYAFPTQKKQLDFTTGCNCATDSDIAFRFTLN